MTHRLIPELGFTLPYESKTIHGIEYPVIPQLLTMFEWLIWSTKGLVPASYPMRYAAWKMS